MSLGNDLGKEVATILRNGWTTRDGLYVPSPEDLALGNDGVALDAAVLYADMAGSTNLVDNNSAEFAAEVYKSYLVCAARIIKSEGGTITAYDGDRIMAIFIGDTKRTTVARAALKINYALLHIVNPAIAAQYPTGGYRLKHTIGIDRSTLLAARIGVRNDNDLVWVGHAANHAAKLSALNDKHPVFVTADVFDHMLDSSKYGGSARRLMWERRRWTQMGNVRVHSSNWTWRI